MHHFDEYQFEALRTAVQPATYAEREFQLSGFGLGIAGEAGEVADYLKKVLHHGHPADADKVKKELGDVLWYTAIIAARFNLSLSEVARANIDKLRVRYPNGWTSEDSINRRPEDD